MKDRIYLIKFILLITTTGFISFSNTNWKIAEGYSIKFTSDNPSGIFKIMRGNIVFDANDLANSNFDMTVDVKSINTGNGIKNRHAVSDKWFDAETYPQIIFKSNEITKTASGYETIGDLFMHGVTKKTSIPFTFEDNTFKGSFEISRVDFQIGKTTGMSAKAATTLKVDIEVPVTN